MEKVKISGPLTQNWVGLQTRSVVYLSRRFPSLWDVFKVRTSCHRPYITRRFNLFQSLFQIDLTRTSQRQDDKYLRQRLKRMEGGNQELCKDAKWPLPRTLYWALMYLYHDKRISARGPIAGWLVDQYQNKHKRRLTFTPFGIHSTAPRY